MKTKLLIIGLDGGEFGIIRPLAEKGKLPFFNEFIRKGVYGILRTTYPPVTAPAWTTFMTGKNPGKHGLFDFQRVDFSGKKEFTYSTDCKSATLWEYLSDANIRMLLVNVPMTYPPRPINGLCIAGFPVPHNAPYVYPPEKQRLVKNLGYLTDWTEVLQKKMWKSKIAILKDVERRRIEVFCKLLKKEPWDIAMIVISGTDHISHLEWQKGNRKEVEQYYICINRLLNNSIAKHVLKNTSIAIMSDHGFTQSEYVFYMNEWLAKEGYLSYDLQLNRSYDKFGEEQEKLVYGKARKLSSVLARVGLTRDNIIFFAKKTKLIKFEKYLPHRLVSIFPGRNLVPHWENTKAYMVSNVSKGLNINLRGREAHGTVSEAEYAFLRLEIVKKLRSLRLDDGTPIFECVDIRENVFNGPFLDQAPDIVTWPTNKCNVKMGKGHKNFLEKLVGAHHTMDGIFMLRGPSIKKSYQWNANIEDVMPTLMHLIGLECPNDLDGKVVKQIFDIESEPAVEEVKFREPLSSEQADEIADVSDESITNKLRALGYL